MRILLGSRHHRAQAAVAGGTRLSEDERRHLARCPQCRLAARRMADFSARLRTEADEVIDELPEPEWRLVFASGRAATSLAGVQPASSHRRERLMLSALALLLLLGVCGPLALRGYRTQRARVYLRADTMQFVNTMVESPLFPGGGPPLTATLDSSAPQPAPLQGSVPTLPE